MNEEINTGKRKVVISKIKHWSIHIIAVLFSIFMLIGMSFVKNGNLDFILGSKKQFCIALLCFFGYLCLFEALIKLIYLLLDNKFCKKGKEEKQRNKLFSFIQKHSFISAFIIILIFWLPWLIVFFPGSLSDDGMRMLLMGTGKRTLTDQHSWFLTLIIGLIFNVGKVVSDNFAIFLITIFFAMFELLCYVVVCKIASRWKLPSWCVFFLILFFSIYPYFGTFAQTVIKDSPFMAAFVLYVALYIDICLICRNMVNTGNPKKSILYEMIVLLFVGFLVCIFRNNGSYLILPATLFLVIVINKGFRRYAVILFICATSLMFTYNDVIAPAFGVTSVKDRAKLSMLFQITGRYIKEYSEDLTNEEVQTLNVVFNKVNNVSELGDLYNAECSDSIKVTYNMETTDENLKDYVQVVYSMIKRHPLVCLEAVLNQSYGYFYPFYSQNLKVSYHLYISSFQTEFNIYYEMPSSVRDMLSNYAELWNTAPVLSLLVNPAFPTWVILLLVGYLTYRGRWREILIFAAPAINMLICMLSPVNGYARYAMPCLACIPILIIWTILVTRNENMEEIKEYG